MGIKVAHIFPVWLPQTQTWMYNQVKHLPPTVDAHILCELTENLDQFGVPNIHCLSEASAVGYYWEKWLRKLRLRRHSSYYVNCGQRIGADIVHSHFGNLAWGNLDTVERLGAKHVVTFYGRDVNMLPKTYRRWLERYQKLFVEADLFLCEGSYMAESLIRLACPKEKVRVFHLGVEIEKIVFCPRNWRPGETLRILIAATFREKKGIPYALAALSQVQHEVPIEITIIGDASANAQSQKEKNKIMEILAQTGLSQKTRMLGFQKHHVLWEQAFNHHIFLSPSVTADDGDTEGGAPVSIIEMQASGMPVIATKHCDIPNVIAPENQKLLADERDVDGLVERLHWLIENPSLWKSVAESGRQHIQMQYDARTQGIQLGTLYFELLDDAELL